MSDTTKDTATASKKGSDGNTTDPHSEISDSNIKGTGDGVDTKGEVKGETGETDTSSASDPESAAAAELAREAEHYAARGPPSRPAGGTVRR